MLYWHQNAAILYVYVFVVFFIYVCMCVHIFFGLTLYWVLLYCSFLLSRAHSIASLKLCANIQSNWAQVFLGVFWIGGSHSLYMPLWYCYCMVIDSVELRSVLSSVNCFSSCLCLHCCGSNLMIPLPLIALRRLRDTWSTFGHSSLHLANSDKCVLIVITVFTVISLTNLNVTLKVDEKTLH